MEPLLHKGQGRLRDQPASWRGGHRRFLQQPRQHSRASGSTVREISSTILGLDFLSSSISRKSSKR